MSVDLNAKTQARLRIDLEDRDAFDSRFGTDTTLPTVVRYRGPNADQAVPCTPSLALTVRLILDALPIDPSPFTFIDIGAGKGRVLLLAAERPFARILGIELSDQLCTIARQNVARYVDQNPSRPPPEVLCADAASFDFPRGKLLLYMYQPFHARVMNQMLERIELAAATSESDIWLAYLCPTYHELIVNSGAWQTMRQEPTRTYSNGFEEYPWTLYHHRPSASASG